MSTETITASARFYRLHREEHLAKKKAEYAVRPDVIAKREEKERKRAEKIVKQEEEKAAKRAEKKKKAQALVLVAEQTRRIITYRSEKTNHEPLPPLIGMPKDKHGRLLCSHCLTWPDSRYGSRAYDGYCATCFKQVFPDDPRSKTTHTHTKELRVRNAINEHFEGFIHDRPLFTGHCDCTMRRRIDHRKLIGGTLLCIETDEFAHKGYDPLDEEIRYDDLFMVHSGKWIFIRFNPDGRGVDMVDKLDRLMTEIQHQTERIERDENTELLEIVKLFY